MSSEEVRSGRHPAGVQTRERALLRTRESKEAGLDMLRQEFDFLSIGLQFLRPCPGLCSRQAEA